MDGLFATLSGEREREGTDGEFGHGSAAAGPVIVVAAGSKCCGGHEGHQQHEYFLHILLHCLVG